MINIALATDDKYAIPAATCVTSFLENNNSEDCAIYVLTVGLSPEKEHLFKKLSSIYKRNISICKIDLKDFEGIDASERFPMSANFRMLLPEIITTDRVLYLDCDIIIRKNIADFYNTDLSGYACGVVENQNGDDIRAFNRLGKDIPYFNSGVLLMNLEFWRKNNIGRTILQCIAENKHFIYPDQDALNKVLHGKVRFCEYTYNFQQHWYNDKYSILLHRDKWKEIDKYKNDPAIVHYTETHKPWTNQCKHPHKEWFFEYANMHGFFAEKDIEDVVSWSYKYPDLYLAYNLMEKNSFSNRITRYCIKFLNRILR